MHNYITPYILNYEEDCAILLQGGIDMTVSEAQLRANKKYQQKFDKVQIRVTHEDKQMIDDHAQSMGESTNAFVRRAITETIARDKKQGTR